MTNGKWDISGSALNNISNNLSDNISISNQNSIIDTEYLLEEIKFIRKENKQLRQQIEEKDRVLEDSRQRQDMIIMQHVKWTAN
jgi:predicted ATP-grasp superfamily ATP-dependent carboligase